jgi:hypothetical protein
MCEPGTYNAVLSYAGKRATVLSVKPSHIVPALSKSALSRLTPEARALIEDQQKAATLLVQFDDDKKLDTCAPVTPTRLSDHIELAEGETLPQSSSQQNVVVQPSTAPPNQTPAAAETLSKEEITAAIQGSGKNHWVRIDDAGLMAAQGAMGTLPHIVLFMPEATIAAAHEEARKQFLPYAPSDEDVKRSLTVLAQGYVGNTYQEGCASITRVVLLSDPTGSVVEESYLSEPGTEAWANGFGATNYCQWLKAKFSLESVRRIRASAKDGEFFIAVFAGGQNTKTYKIKHKHQAKLGLE